MFLDLYYEIEDKIKSANVTGVSDIKYYCDNMVKAFFKNVFPDYENYIGNIEGIIKECANKLSDRFNASSDYINEQMEKELNELLPGWKNFLDINNLANKLSDKFVDMYYNNKNNENKDVCCFDDAVMKTIIRNIELGVEINNKKDLEKFLLKLFNEYFDKNNKYAFTSRNKARKYVISKTKRELLQEMMDTAKIESNLPSLELENAIRNSYINQVIKNFKYNGHN